MPRCTSLHATAAGGRWVLEPQPSQQRKKGFYSSYTPASTGQGQPTLAVELEVWRILTDTLETMLLQRRPTRATELHARWLVGSTAQTLHHSSPGPGLGTDRAFHLHGRHAEKQRQKEQNKAPVVLPLYWRSSFPSTSQDVPAPLYGCRVARYNVSIKRERRDTASLTLGNWQNRLCLSTQKESHRDGSCSEKL
jgi:hypothetical protein